MWILIVFTCKQDDARLLDGAYKPCVVCRRRNCGNSQHPYGWYGKFFGYFLRPKDANAHMA